MPTDQPGRQEDTEEEKERLERELGELLQELRVALPGVQVLFAFLLTIPFTQRFSQVGSLERDVYFAGFLCAMFSTVMLITPTAYHRIRFRHHDKRRLVAVSNRLAIMGLGLLALAMSCTVFVIANQVFGRALGISTGILSAIAFGTFWFAVPLSRIAVRRA